MVFADSNITKMKESKEHLGERMIGAVQGKVDLNASNALIEKAMKNVGLNAAEFGQLTALCEQMVDALPADLRKKYDSYSR